jgi:hypothetical protein
LVFIDPALDAIHEVIRSSICILVGLKKRKDGKEKDGSKTIVQFINY